MRPIRKGRPPKTVTESLKASTTNLSATSSARSAFDQIDKVEVRKLLASEQEWLCAFCMRRIDHLGVDASGMPTMAIAHRTPIAVDPSKALDWNNMVGSCDGGRRSEGPWTCDASQGSQALTVDPTVSTSVAQLRYERRPKVGRGLFITSDLPGLRDDVDERLVAEQSRPGVLALNEGDLPLSRDAAVRAFQTLCAKLKLYGRPGWKKHYPKWLAAHSQQLRRPEYVGAIESLL